MANPSKIAWLERAARARRARMARMTTEDRLRMLERQQTANAAVEVILIFALLFLFMYVLSFGPDVQEALGTRPQGDPPCAAFGTCRQSL